MLLDYNEKAALFQFTLDNARIFIVVDRNTKEVLKSFGKLKEAENYISEVR